MSSTGEDPGGSGLAAGANYFGALTNQQRQTAAYNAIAATHGPVEAYGLVDPQGALGAQEYGQREQTNPIAVKQAGATLAQTQLQTQQAQSEALRNAQVRALYMIKSTVNPQTGAADPAAVDNLVGKNAAALGFTDPAQYAAFRDSITVPGGAGQIDQHIQGLLAPQQIMGARPIVYGKDGQAYQVQSTKTGQTAMVPLGSVEQASVVNNQANLPIKQQQANAATVNAGAHVLSSKAAAYTAGLGGPGGVPVAGAVGALPGDNRPSANFGGGNTLPQPSTDLIGAGNPPGSTPAPAPVPRRGMSVIPNNDGTGYTQVPTSSLPKAGPNQQQVFNPQTGQVEQRTVQITQSPQATAIARADLGQMDLQYARTGAMIDSALKMVGPTTTGYGGRVSEMLGTPQREQLDSYVNSIKSNAALLTANLARNGGKNTSIPVRNMQEFKAYQDAIGAVNLKASSSDVADQLNTLKQRFGDLQQAVHQKYGATYGDGVFQQNTGGPAKITTNAQWSALPKGTQYVAPDGQTRVKQ